MSAHLAEAIFRYRYLLCGLIVAGFVAFLPITNFTNIDNDLDMWISKDDPVYQQYERFRAEFGGQRTLLVALQSDRLFDPASLEFIRQVTGDIERVALVERVHSLATANIVRSLPATADDDGGIEVQPLVGDRELDPDATRRIRDLALGDRLLRGDLVSDDGTVTAIVVSFDEDRIDDERGEVIDRIHKLIDPRLPAGMTAHYNGSLEISETYNRITLENTYKLTPPILLLTIAGIYLMFRSWRITGLLMVAVLVSAVWTMGLYVLMGFEYNVIASMIPPLVLILAVADDVHIVQHFNHELRATGSKEVAFKSSVQHLFLPLLAASGTTALGLFSLATTNVVAVRQFGIGAGVGIMVDFVMSLVFVPFLLLWLKPEPGLAPQERYLVGPMQRVARFSMGYAKPVLQEALRLYPVGWLIPRSVVTPDELDGEPIPKGATVFLSPYVTHRLPSLWDRPAVFDPRRFTDPPKRHRYAYFPFGGGVHQCLGSHFFLVEAQLILASLLRRFRPVLVDPGPIAVRAAATLRPRRPVRMLLRPR